MLIVSNSQCWVAAKSPCFGLEGQVLGLGLEGLVLVNISDMHTKIWRSSATRFSSYVIRQTHKHTD